MAGSCVRIVLRVQFIALTRRGGHGAIATGAGFSLNRMTAVCRLILMGTMEGGAVGNWNRALYLRLSLPMIAFYFFMYVTG